MATSMRPAPVTTDFATLVATISEAGTSSAAVEALILGLSARIKATSNDQNVQRLARDLQAAAPDFVTALAAMA